MAGRGQLQVGLVDAGVKCPECGGGLLSFTHLDHCTQSWREKEQAIFFYRATGQYGWLSNLYKEKITYNGFIYSSAEAAYQAGKPRDQTVAQWLSLCPKQSVLATSAHALLPFDIVSNWNQIKVERMRGVLRAKFCHPVLLGNLIDTGNTPLYEKSNTDSFWGIGKIGNGKNMLGQLLMELRANLTKESV